MTALTDMSEDEIKAALAALHNQSVVIATERHRLDDELRRRDQATRSKAVVEALGHANFGLSLDAQIAVCCRIPDSDWIEGDWEAQELTAKVQGAIGRDIGVTHTVTIGSARFSLRNDGDRFYIWPHNRMDLGAWEALIALAGGRLALSSSHDIEALERVLPLLRASIHKV